MQCGSISHWVWLCSLSIFYLIFPFPVWKTINQSIKLRKCSLAHQHAINMVVPFLCGQKYTLPQRRGGKKAFATSET
jgi:hypothetical protein